ALLAAIDEFLLLPSTSERLPFRSIRLYGKTLIDQGEIRTLFASTDQRLKLPDRLAAAKKLLLRRLNECEESELEADWVSAELELVSNEMLRKAGQEVRRRQRKTDTSFNEHTLEERILREMIVKKRFDAL